VGVEWKGWNMFWEEGYTFEGWGYVHVAQAADLVMSQPGHRSTSELLSAL